MNRFNRIPHRDTWCQLKKLQSSLSAPNAPIQIPTRIKREPTDILKALGSTIPHDTMKINYSYHDDPFLQPLKKIDYRSYALSYEAGKKAAMWIHKEHRDLFPKHLSEPEIEAFKPCEMYNDKSQVSEEILLDVISKCRVSDAIHIYKLLETSVSNEIKQALLELLCFYNDEANALNDFPFERWFIKSQNKNIWRYNSEINDLYQFLITQDSATAAAAHNAMICGLARYSRADEAWSIYQECKKNDVPLNVTTYNYVLTLIPKIFSRKNAMNVQCMFDILKSMAEKGIKPNIRTLNAALRASTLSMSMGTERIVKHLFAEFKRMNIQFSLATYYYAMVLPSQQDKNSYRQFVNTLSTMEHQSYTIQDPMDTKFFGKAMYLANHYTDRKCGNMIHSLFLFGNNRKLISDSAEENAYYKAYMSLLLSTSTVTEFFKIYEELVPSSYVPDKRILHQIIDDWKYKTPEALAKCLPRLWSDINALYQMDVSLKLSVIQLMKMDSLPHDSPLRTTFADAAWNCWTNIKTTIEERPDKYSPVETVMTGYIAMLLLQGGRPQESIEVLTSTVKQSHLYIPTMNDKHVDQLFQSCISQQCITGAILVLEYATNLGFQHITQMAKQLYNLPQLTNMDRDKLINLVGVESLNTSDTSSST